MERLRIEPSRAVRDAIFQALTRIDADAAIEGASRLFGSDDPQIRNQAVEILRSKGDAAIPFLEHRHARRRQGLAQTCPGCLEWDSGRAGAEAIYEAALSDPDPNVVITAVENLGRAHAHALQATDRRSAPGRIPIRC